MKVGDKYQKKVDKTIWTVETWGDFNVCLSDGHTKEYPSHEQLKLNYTKK